jgi:tetratricopeptide (TPR) repeat protein
MKTSRSELSPVLVERRLTSTRFDGWKLISQYLGRCPRTVQRWHSQHALPIRHLGGDSGSVFAYSNELDTWLRSRGMALQSLPSEAIHPALAAVRRPVLHLSAAERGLSVPDADPACGDPSDLLARAQKIWATLSQSNLRVLSKLYREVIDQEIENAEAFAGLARALIAASILGNLRNTTAYSAAKAAVNRAHEISPDLPAAKLAGAWLMMLSERNWQGARLGFDELLNDSPLNVSAFVGRALLHIAENCPAEASRLLHQVTQKESLNSAAMAFRIWSEYLAGRSEMALAMAGQARARGDSGAFLDAVEAFASFQAEAPKTSIRRMEAFVERSPQHSALQGVLGYAYAMSGEPEKARSIFHKLTRPEVQETFNHAYTLALIMIGLNERSSAVHLLEQAYREGSIWSLGFHSDPILTPLHEDLNYQILMGRIKYPVLKLPAGAITLPDAENAVLTSA